MKKANRIAGALLTAIALVTLTACNDGPAEEMGEDIDHAIEKSSNSIDNTMDKAGEKLEEAGDSMKN